MKGHNDYINSIAYEPEVGDMIVTASDDHTARVWDSKVDASKALIHTFSLNSPGCFINCLLILGDIFDKLLLC